MNIIGGKFGLPKKLTDYSEMPQFLEGDPVLMFNGRSCIKQVVDSLKPKHVWLPSYLCPTIISAIDTNISKICFYPIDINLSVKSIDFINKIIPGDLFLFINYFGFDFLGEILNTLRGKEIILFRDCCQALFFNWKKNHADFCLFSPRKFLGVTDGGILHRTSNLNFKPQELIDPPEDALLDMFYAILGRREFDLNGIDREWNTHFHQGENKFFPGNSRMSKISTLLLKHSFDYEAIIERRKRNYSALLNKLGPFAVFPELTKGVVPLGFPIKIKNRNSVQEELFKRNIFPPIHWNIDGFVPNNFLESHQLANQIMTLPCDQRYDESDLNRIADILTEIIA